MVPEVSFHKYQCTCVGGFANGVCESLSHAVGIDIGFADLNRGQGANSIPMCRALGTEFAGPAQYYAARGIVDTGTNDMRALTRTDVGLEKADARVPLQTGFMQPTQHRAPMCEVEAETEHRVFFREPSSSDRTGTVHRGARWRLGPRPVSGCRALRARGMLAPSTVHPDAVYGTETSIRSCN
eukprot:SAG11_NODE_1286_length_5299_cov_18.976923_7_plen_183_part_00